MAWGTLERNMQSARHMRISTGNDSVQIQRKAGQSSAVRPNLGKDIYKLFTEAQIQFVTLDFEAIRVSAEETGETWTVESCRPDLQRACRFRKSTVLPESIGPIDLIRRTEQFVLEVPPVTNSIPNKKLLTHIIIIIMPHIRAFHRLPGTHTFPSDG